MIQIQKNGIESFTKNNRLMEFNSRNKSKNLLSQKEQLIETAAVGLAILLLLASAIKVLFI